MQSESDENKRNYLTLVRVLQRRLRLFTAQSECVRLRAVHDECVVVRLGAQPRNEHCAQQFETAQMQVMTFLFYFFILHPRHLAVA